MPSPLMCVNNRGGSPTPRLLLNGTVLVPFGTPPVVTSEPTFAGLAAADQERIAQVGDRIFWVQYDSVLEYDKALDTWSSSMYLSPQFNTQRQVRSSSPALVGFNTGRTQAAPTSALLWHTARTLLATSTC